MNSRLINNARARDILVEVTSAIILIFFVHTLISSLIQLQSLKNLLGFYTFYTTQVAWSIVIFEAVTATLLFLPRTRLIGCVCAVIFSITAIITIIRTPGYPHDFGGIVNHIPTKQKFIVYGTMTVLGVIAFTISVLSKRLRQSQEHNTVVFT